MAKASMNLGGLEKLSKSLKKKYTLRVGIIGSKAKAVHDSESGLTNAELGSVHEFGAHINHPGGTPYKILGDGRAQFVSKKDGAGLPTTGPHEINIPARSFLEQPLKEKLKEKISQNKKTIFKQVFKDNDTEAFLNDLGAEALEIINGAFQTNGYGSWKELTAGTKRQKSKKGYSPDPLITTGRGGLSSTIDFKVMKND